MEGNRCFCMILLFFITVGLSASSVSSNFISEAIFDSQTSTGRNLLQAKKGCPVNFEFKNYTIITSKCKGPRYPADLCCAAFKEFACPYADDINDLTNDCASTMFSYINIYGNYPPGLFASECREGKEGLACAGTPPATSTNISSSRITCYPSPLSVISVGFSWFLL